MNNTPSDAGIWELIPDDRTMAVTLGFAIENRAGIDVLVWKDGGCRPATSAEVAMWKALAAVQQPVAPAPLSESEYKRGYRDGYERRDAEVQGALV